MGTHSFQPQVQSQADVCCVDSFLSDAFILDASPGQVCPGRGDCTRSSPSCHWLTVPMGPCAPSSYPTTAPRPPPLHLSGSGAARDPAGMTRRPLGQPLKEVMATVASKLMWRVMGCRSSLRATRCWHPLAS